MTVDEYIAKAPEAAQTMMKQIREVIKEVSPEATEKFSYGMPFYEYKYPGYRGRMAYFGAFTHHVSFFVVPRQVPAALVKEYEQYKTSKSALQFPFGTEVPIKLIKELVKLRMQEIESGD